jgi:hypothetical protein
MRWTLRWSSRRFSRTLLACALAAGSALLGCLARRAAEVRQRLVGVPGTEIQRCLGIPSTREELDGRAVWLYEAMYSGPPGAATIEIAQGSGAVALPPRVIPGALGPDSLLGTPQPGESGEPAPRGTCVLVFELESGVVSHFHSAGRTPEGANGSSECALLALDCVPQEPPR